MIEALLILGLAILLAATARAAFIRQRMRRSLRELASRRRLNFTPTDLIGAYERYQHLDLINRGHSRCTWNVIYGTMPQGLVTLFAFACERGLGTHRANQERWIVVLEALKTHSPWRACRTAEPQDGTDSSDRWTITAEHEHVRHLLDELKFCRDDDGRLHEMEWEVRGRLVALACPFTRDPDVPARMIDEVIRVAEDLRVLERTL